MDEPQDQSALHRSFSVRAYNAAADLLYKEGPRTEDETRQMLSLAHVAYWHRSQRPDVSDTQLATGLWLLSRAHAAVGEARLGLEYGRQSLALAGGEAAASYLVACALEAIARSQAMLGDKAEAAASAAKARALAEASDDDNKRYLLGDLDTIVLS
ncbi:MAG TPA: hypothetical protein VGS12_03830 [Caulobacteraceae bacterium]|nr:hypothetical protein [Caulobacteraceae bacterium]